MMVTLRGPVKVSRGDSARGREGVDGCVREIGKDAVYAKIADVAMLELGAPAVGGGQEWRIVAQRPHMDTEPEPMGAGN
jgi:hypothetical protein